MADNVHFPPIGPQPEPPHPINVMEINNAPAINAPDPLAHLITQVSPPASASKSHPSSPEVSESEVSPSKSPPSSPEVAESTESAMPFAIKVNGQTNTENGNEAHESTGTNDAQTGQHQQESEDEQKTNTRDGESAHQDDKSNQDGEEEDEEKEEEEDKGADHSDAKKKMKYSDRYSRPLMTRRYIFNNVRGSAPKKLNRKRLLFDALDSGWERFMEGEEFSLPEEPLNKINNPRFVEKIKKSVVPDFKQFYINVNHSFVDESNQDPIANPYGFLPTFTESTELRAIGSKIEREEPHFLELVQSLRTIIHAKETSIDDATNVQSLYMALKRGLNKDEMLEVTTIARPDKNTDETDVEGYEVDDGSVFDGMLFPQDDDTPSSLHDEYHECQPYFTKFERAHFVALACIYIKQIYHQYRDVYEYPYEELVRGHDVPDAQDAHAKLVVSQEAVSGLFMNTTLDV